MQNLSVVVLAAGKGTRMNHDTLPKVLVPFRGNPMLGYVLETVTSLAPEKTVVIVGYKSNMVSEFVDQNYNSKLNITCTLQSEQLGTGHAVMMAEKELEEFNGTVLILCGDVPKLSSNTLDEMFKSHIESKADLTVLTAIADDPNGYGRVVKDGEGNFLKIVEQKDASTDEKKILEINSGTYLVNKTLLFNALENIKNDNAQNEYYLTDIVSLFKQSNRKIGTYTISNFDEIVGINSKEDLAAIEKLEL